jgi:predicted flap endonuclease-1-like 5' DNA nuclease
MRLHYGGPAGVRVIGDLRWSRENDWTVDAPALLAAEALCQSGERFEAAQDEPLKRLHGITDDALLDLAMAGVGNVDELAALDADQVKNLSATLPKIAAWKRQAAGILKQTEE